ncbi:MAG: SAM-dependent methyltransferase [Alloprevotella sp.]|nr:SAM-dependent methyltransferase [Alloprevotella sp.]
MTTEEFISQHRGEPVTKLALSIPASADIDVPRVLRQIAGWQRLRSKVPSWAECDGIEYPGHLPLEQCSSEAAARYKAEVVRALDFPQRTLTDLTGGLGVDFSFLAPLFIKARYVERQADLVMLACHNLPLLGVKNADFIEGDTLDYLREMAPADLLFLDPARRDATTGRKTVRLADCEPNVVELLPLLRRKSTVILLKLSPMLDLKRTMEELDCPMEPHIFAYGGECKELLLVLHNRAPRDTLIHRAEDNHRFTFTLQDEAAARPTYLADVATGSYLYEPGPALLKAGAYRITATRYGLGKLHPNSHLYIAAQCVENFPGRRFEVIRTSSFAKRELRAFTTGYTAANIAVRNFPASVAELRKRLGVREGGEEYWFATTLADGRRMLIACRKV